MPQIIASNSGGTNYEPVPAGNYPARCYSMIHIGNVVEEFQGEKKTMNKVRLTWELPTETKVFKEEKGEQPYVLSKDFTLSMHEKSTLRKWLEAWRGKGFTNDESAAFDITKLVGKPCMVNVIHTTKGDKAYANISGVSAMPKGLNCPEQMNPSVIFSVLEFDQKVFETFPDFLKDKIKSSKEYKEMDQPGAFETAPEHNESQEDNDSLPF
jgi:hypothetical protein